MSSRCLCMLFCATAGHNGESLGADEQEIVILANLILDLNKSKVIGIQRQYIKPRSADVKSDFLSTQCKLETDLNENIIRNAQYLENVIDDLDRYLHTRNLYPDYKGNRFTFVTDGPLHLRQCLIPECTKKGFNLPSYYYSYFDLRKEFCKFYGNIRAENINQMLQYLMLPQNTDVDYCMRQCNNMEKIVSKMIGDGYEFKEPEHIMQVLDQGIWYISADDEIEDNTIVRARGLPWQCTDQDVAKFFRGLNIAKGGIALCLSSQGRRNGEALVRLISEEHRDLALRRHKHHIGQRYIEVYRASGKEFLNVAAGSNSEAQTFLSRNGQVIVRMRGLPFDATAKEVTSFFENGDHSTEIVDGEQGVLFVHYPDGRSTGDAFVMFKSEEEASRALLKHKETMGTRYIELFRSTTAEVQQVFKRSQDPKHYQNALKDMPFSPLPLLPPEMISGGNRRDCIRLRNLPLECGVEQILEFLGVHSQHIVHQGVHMIFNSQGQPSGEAFIQMDTEQAAFNSSNHKHNKYLFFSGKKYFIEVIQCSGEEMNLVLMGLVPSNLLTIQRNPNVSPRAPLNAPVNVANFQANSVPFPLITANPALMSNNLNGNITTTPTTSAVSTAMFQQPLAPIPITTAANSTHINAQAINTTPLITQNANTSTFYPQILYWYPTPPVSPTSAIYIHPSSMMHPAAAPSIIVLRGVPLNATVADIMHFLNGFPEVSPDCIQIQRTPDGRATGDVLVTFFNRSEAERAVLEKNHQLLGNRVVELYLAV